MASIANALEVLDIRRSQREIAKLCNVTEEDGTDEVEMKRALLANDVAIDEWSSTDAPESSLWLSEHLYTEGPAILCVDDSDHWITAIGWCAGTFILFDPARNTGVECHTRQSLARRWVDADGIYYAIGVANND